MMKCPIFQNILSKVQCNLQVNLRQIDVGVALNEGAGQVSRPIKLEHHLHLLVRLVEGGEGVAVVELKLLLKLG